MTDYGIGIIEGQQIGEEFIRKRPKHIIGPFVIKNKTFMAASGSTRYYGCPWGTFILTPQDIGSTIARLYRRFGIDPHEEDFNTVWNIGLLGNITAIGYDLPVRRRRGSIQLHSDPALKSMGCIVLNKEQFVEVARILKKEEEKHPMAIEICPMEDGANFRIFPRT